MKLSVSVFGNQPRRVGEHIACLKELCATLDRSGIDTIWFPERHGKPNEIAHANPLINIVASAIITQEVRLATGSWVTPYYPAALVKAQLQQALEFTDGRLRLAIGKGWDENEFSAYYADFAGREARLKEDIETVRGILPENSSEHCLRTISSARSSWDHAADQGSGVYCGIFGRTLESLRHEVRNYRTRLLNSPQRRDAGWVACMTHLYIDPDPEMAKHRYATAIRPYMTVHSNRATGQRGAVNSEKLADGAIQRMTGQCGLIGSASEIQQRLHDYRAAGVDEVVMLMDFDVDPCVTINQAEELVRLLKGNN